MQQLIETRENRLLLENYGFFMKPFAAICFLPTAFSMIKRKVIFPPLTFHIFNKYGHALGLSNGDVCYPSCRSDNQVYLEKMIIALEDRRFFNHSGLDLRGVIRALYQNILHLRLTQGGSTITQQLVRNVLLSPDRSIVRKLLETVLAKRIEKFYDKSTIVSAYCSYVYLGYGVRGFEAASRTIYRKPIKSLNKFEMAGLVGLLRAPNKYHPLQKYDIYKKRQNQIAVRFQIDSENDLVNPIAVSSFKRPRLSSIISRLLKQENITQDDVKSVQTSIDSSAQSLADTQLRHYSLNEDIAGISLVVLDNASGEVLVESSWKDGKNSEFSPVFFGKIQPGSTFKPFTLISAIEQGISLDIRLKSAPFISTIFKNANKTPWIVRNYAHIYRGEINLTEALRYSDNSVFARLTELIDQRNQFDVFRRFRLSRNTHITPAVSLGSIADGIPLIDLANAYRAIAQNGVMSDPSICKAIIMRDGTAILPNKNPSEVLISYSTAKQIQYALKVSGQAVGAAGFSGKTGTTKQGQIFSGYNEKVSVAIWLGYKSPQSEYAHKGLTAVGVLNKFSDALLGHHHGRLLEII